MRLPRLYQWPDIAWLLVGPPIGVLFAVLDDFAVYHRWWSDSYGWTAGVAALLGVVIGAGIWILLIAISERQWRKHERGAR